MTETLKPGDTVVLKSEANILMTIEETNNSSAHCIWFHPESKEIVKKQIALVALTKAN